MTKQVFREYQIFGYHPKEQIECAFDVVTPAGADVSCRVSADAEVLVAAEEILTKLPAFRDVGYFFRLSHAQLLRGVLINCGVADEAMHAEVHSVMREAAKMSKTQRCARLVNNLGMSELAAKSLMDVLEYEGTHAKVAGALRHLTRRNNQASAMIKAGLSDLQAVIERARLMGLCCSTVVSPSLVHNPGHFSGLMCQLVRKKKRGSHEIVAAGGRYDHLLDRFGHLSMTNTMRQQQQQDGEDSAAQSAVGISLALDKLVAVVAADPEGGFDGAEVLLVSESGSDSRRAEAALAGKLWAAGVRCLLCGGATPDQALEIARDTSAKFVVFFREIEGVRVRCLDKDRFQEKKVAAGDAADFLLRQLRQQLGSGDSFEPAASFGGSGQAPPASSSSLSSSSSSQHRAPDTGPQYSAGSSTASSSSSSVHVNYNFRFYQYQDKSKTTMTSRKRLESTISSKITPLLALLASGSVVDVLALPLPSSVLQSAAAFLKLDSDEAAFTASVRHLLERHSRHRRDLSNICDEIQELHFERSRSVVVLYSADDHGYATIVAP